MSLNTTQKYSKPKAAIARQTINLHLGNSTDGLFLARGEQSFIQWPTELEVQEVSIRLAELVQAGIRWETSGDYFKSGDLAYRIREIIGLTAEQLKKCQRANG